MNVRSNKCNATKAMCSSGHKHDSKKEARRCDELNLMQRAGLIKGLNIQPKYELIPAKKDSTGKTIERQLNYIADFSYTTSDGQFVVEDVKGCKKGAVYNLFVVKRKLMLHIHGIRVIEV